MKKKISVFALLLSLMLALLVPVQAKANTTTESIKYTDVVDYMESNGYVFTKKEDCYYVVISDGYDARLRVLELYYPHDAEGIFLARDTTYNNLFFFTDEVYASTDFVRYNFYLPQKAAENNKFDYVSYDNLFHMTCEYNGVLRDISYTGLSVPSNYSLDILYSDFNIYQVDRKGSGTYPWYYESYDVLYFESNRLGPYTFLSWCNDAGLTITASSNETEETFPFIFNSDNWYIVRKNRVSGSQYTWYVSEFRRYDDDTWHLYGSVRAMAESSLGIADLSDELTMQTIPVNNYVYDSSGSGWLFVDRPSFTLQTGENYIDDIGISFSSSMPIVYSSTDIYSDKEQSSVYYAATTEYEDTSEIYPEISPTSMPTPTPSDDLDSSGAGRPGSGTRPSVGGEASGGGGLDFIINLFTLIWTKICSIPMAVDGYSISLQQIIVYGALVGIVGGFIMKFIFGRR